MTKKIRNFILLGVTLSLVTSAAITIPLVMTHNTTITANNVVNGNTSENTDSNTTTQGVDSNSKLITSALAKKESSDSSSKPNMNGFNEVKRITKDFTPGFSNYTVFKYNYSREDINYDTVGSEAYETQNLYQGVDYYNQRDVMPILSSSYNYSYPNERSQMDVEWDSYHGWNKSDISYYNQATYGNTYKQTTYTASDTLKKTLSTDAASNLTIIKSLNVDFNDSYLASMDANQSINVVNSTINSLANQGYNFIIISNASQTQLEGIKIPTGIKKLTIKDFDGKLQSLRGIDVSDSVQELEFYSTTAKKIDPLVLPSSAHFIYDHISGDNVTRGNLTFSPFTMIDLTSHKKLTNENLQKAINTIYGERQYERNFQGDFSGGYIYQIDLSGTGVTSLNSVYVPSQSDGRFNLAYVVWSSGASNGSATITIGAQQINPGNDGNVNEWYDSSNEADKVIKLILQTETSKTITSDAVKTEINGLLKKYPNVKEIDITKVSLVSSESKKDLAQLLYETLVTHYTSKGLEVPSDLKVIYGNNLEITSSSTTK